MTILVAAITIPLWSWVDLYKAFPRNTIVRRILKFIPYFVPIATFGISLKPGLASILICAGTAAVCLIVTYPQIKEVLNRRVLALMPRQTLSRRASEAIFFLGSAIAQEYLHRYVLVLYLMEIKIPLVNIVVITAATFVLEHFIVRDGGHTAKSSRNIILWVTLGLIFGTASVCNPDALLGCIIGHGMINMPAAIRPFLRGARKVTLER
ncbi:type II CAAX prenyl endopeptidase Rce1 family protein [Microbacterium sp. EST19A]|uniref:CPBP family glutamic-type intramembrane protease n=1 Tax=Microbacterium sp. EST19A TaxID=2862681 RepID=UPI001CBCC792|nr:hypothetical protein [Microbacterium sp. EST19A]